MSSCLDSIKKFINNNIHTLFDKNDDYKYYLMKDIKNKNDLNEHLMDINETYQVFSIDDDNMIKSIIKENDELIRSCEIDINNKSNNETENNQILMTNKEVEEVLNNSLKKNTDLPDS